MQRPGDRREPFSLEDVNVIESLWSRVTAFPATRSLSVGVWHGLQERGSKHWLRWWKWGL